MIAKDISSLLDAAANLLDEKAFTCVLYNGENIITSTQRGVAPLVDIINRYGHLEGYVAADKVVGRATALLYVKLGVSAVYAKTLSEGAASIFKKHSIPFTYDSSAEYIINRKGDDMCPMEKTVWEITSPDEAFDAVRTALDKLRHKS